MRVFERLIGLETEYAVRFQLNHDRSDGRLPNEEGTERRRGTERKNVLEQVGRRTPPSQRRGDGKSNYHLFNALMEQVGRRTPMVRAHHFKKGYFTANGGAVWYEKVRQADRSGLVEGTTPECRGPRQLLAYQRAQDELLAAAAREVECGGTLTLVKNDRDARGHVFGAHENYEVRLAGTRGFRVWRWGRYLLMPLALLGWLLLLGLLFALLLYYLVAALLFPFVAAACELLRPLFPRLTADRVRAALFGREFDRLTRDGDEYGAFLPDWLEPLVLFACQVVIAPLAVGLLVLVRLTVWRDLRRQLLPFLISRAVVTGSGRVADDGRYHVAAKATGLNCLVGLNGFLGDRPVFSFGHFLKALFGYGLYYGGAWQSLFAERQRLQICLGDSNLCEEAEYLRIGTTLLVLDAIEAGHMPSVPRVRRSLRTLKRIAADATLTARVDLSGGRRWTAIEIQRFYLSGCRAFLQKQPDAPDEAWDVLWRWEDVLDRLEMDPASLFGRVDWITKRELLDQCGADAPWEVRKKIDLKYHELGPEGYFEQLRPTDTITTLLSPEERDRATRMPPPHTPATARGHYIREFAQGGDIQANWDTITLGTGPDAKVIELAKYGKDQKSPHSRPV